MLIENLLKDANLREVEVAKLLNLNKSKII